MLTRRSFVSLPVLGSATGVAHGGEEGGFGRGSDVGTLRGNVWFPGRDASGRVTLASWATVPQRRWLTIDSTQLASLNAEVLASTAGWTTASLAWGKLFQSWSGFALDSRGNRLWFLGGGHSDGHNNGLYRFDLTRMSWAIECLPSDRSRWAANYNPLSATSYENSKTAAEAKLASGRLSPINDIYWDELPDGKPTARHTYSSLVYVPELQEVVMTARRLWRYSLTERRWHYKRLIRDQYEPWMDAESVIAAYDEATGEVLFTSAGSRAKYRSTGYDLRNNLWTPWSAPWHRFSGCADVRHQRVLALFHPPARGEGPGSARPGRYWLYDLDRRVAVRTGQVRLAGGLSAEAFASARAFYDGASMTYIESRGEYWVCTLMADNKMAFLMLDPSTEPWEMRPLMFEGPIPAPKRLLTRRMNYWPRLDALTLADNGDQDIHLYRL